MKVDQFLNEKSIDALGEICAYWQPLARVPRSKSALTRQIRTMMLDPEAVNASYERLAREQKWAVEMLLQCKGYRSTPVEVAAAARGSKLSGREVADVFAALAAKGLVATTSQKDWSENTMVAATIPAELGRALSKSLKFAVRRPSALLSLEHQLRSLPEKQLQTQLASLGVKARRDGDPRRLARTLSRFEATQERISRLRDTGLRDAIEEAITQHGGLLLLSNARARPDREKEWRESLEASFLGTIGNLSFSEHWMSSQERFLVVYEETVKSYLCSAPFTIDSERVLRPQFVDFLRDVSALVNHASAWPIRTTQHGSLYRSVANRLLKQLCQEGNPFWDARALLDLKLEVCTQLRLLAGTPEQTIEVRPEAEKWLEQDLVHKTRSVLHCLLEQAPQTWQLQYQPEIFSFVRRILLAAGPGHWIPASALFHLALAMYLRKADEQPAGDERQDLIAHSAVLANCCEIASAAIMHLCPRLFLLGLVDLAVEDKEPVAVRITPFGEELFAPRKARDRSASATNILVNPDFEVVLFPDDDAHGLIYLLDQFTDRLKCERTYHFRITRRSVGRAAACGMSADAMLGALTDHSQKSIPQNVSYSVRSWAETARRALLTTALILEVDDPEALKLVKQLPGVKPLVDRELSPKVLILKELPRDRKIVEALEELGVYLRSFSGS